MEVVIRHSPREKDLFIPDLAKFSTIKKRELWKRYCW